MYYTPSFDILLSYRAALFDGLLNTLQLTAVSIALGLLLGFVLSLLRQAKSPFLAVPAGIYVEFFRGTPVLIQLFWIFFCLPLILGMELGNFVSALLALTLYMGAITCESFRAALRTIPDEHYQACTALGIGSWVQTVYVILPQTLMRAAPTLLSNAVTLFKESALVSAVGMSDLMHVSSNISNSTARPVEVLSAAALIYFIIAFPLTRMVSALEGGLRRKLSI